MGQAKKQRTKDYFDRLHNQEAQQELAEIIKVQVQAVDDRKAVLALQSKIKKGVASPEWEKKLDVISEDKIDTVELEEIE